MANPVMRMGLVGFANEEHLANLLKVRTRVLRWEPWPAVEADALLVDGTSAEPAAGRLVRVPATGPAGSDTLLDLADISRPTAFSLPLHHPAVRPPLVFDPRSPASIAQALRLLEVSVLRRAAQLALAEALLERHGTLHSPVYHLVRRGTMLGVIDPNNEIGLLPGVTPADIEAADWHGRPAGANGIPPHYHRISWARLVWRYAVRRRTHMLPSNYLSATIHLRRLPAVEAGDLADNHLLVLSELSATPRSAAQLQQLTGLAQAPLAQALWALHLLGCVGTGNPPLDGWRQQARQAPRLLPHIAVPTNAQAVNALEIPRGRWSGDGGRDTVPTPLTRSLRN